MQFTKMHGLGNDYVYFDWRAGMPLPEEALPDLAKRISDRHRGVGSDGFIALLPSETADFAMRMFNADGSEGEMCGNGIRCLAKYVYDRQIKTGDEIHFDTKAGLIKVFVVQTERGKARELKVDMGRPSLEPGQLGLAAAKPWVEERIPQFPEYQGTAVSMGNPHLVIFTENREEIPLAQVGPRLEHHPAFLNRTNVEFVRVIGQDKLQMDVWERGSGITEACGTGACATFVAASMTGRVGKKATVSLRGGDLEIEWGEDGHIYMTGPATEVFTGIWYEEESY